MIPFNKPSYTANEDQYVLTAMRSNKLSGDGFFSKKCEEWFNYSLKCKKSLLTPSCTQALEMAAILLDIKPGDEIIMPSYTFVSTANAFVLRGATIVFIDIRHDTMNINETLIETAINPKTKAIVPVHYAGVACDMDAIVRVANRYGLFVIEDAAQGMTSTYNGKPLGTIGHMGAYSFHETKNYTSGGEGGLLIINDERFVNRAEIIREKGTNRNQFFRGMVDKYSWVDLGSSYLPSEIQAAYLWGQIERVDTIRDDRLSTWQEYAEMLTPLQEQGLVVLPKVPVECNHNGHMFYLKAKNIDERSALLEHLKAHDVHSVFHYVPLHSSPAGERFSRFHDRDYFTTKESERLIRLPLWYGLDNSSIHRVGEAIKSFYSL